jgi:hypothetical protein
MERGFANVVGKVLATTSDNAPHAPVDITIDGKDGGEDTFITQKGGKMYVT